VKSLASFRLDLPVVDATAVGASLALGNFKAASTLMMLLNTGAYLEAWAKQRSRENLAAALSKNVDNVWVRQDGALRQIPYSELRKGDAIVLRSGSLIPIDGKVIEGRALVNEAALTGQPLVSEKTAGLLVHSGTVVQEGEIIAEVHTKGNDTSYEQTIALVEEGEGAKAGIGIKANKLADKAVPFTLAFAALVFLATRNPRKAASVLTVDYSCAIKLATPLAFLAAMREGLSNGAFFKGGASMEQFAACDTIVFGKASVLAADTNEAAQVISMLRHLGIKRIYLLSEDETSAAEKIARELSLDSYRGGLSPEDKTGMVKRLRERGCRLAFVGDGINDSPAMSAADVGIAMQDGVDLALQAADITLKESSLYPLVIARLISQRVMKRIRGNITTAIVLNSAFILLGLLENPAPGNAGSTRAAWLHNISTLILSINAMRPVLKESKQ
jgi:Cu2+-exporting ATPase